MKLKQSHNILKNRFRSASCYDDVSVRRIRDLLMRPYFTVREWLWRVHKRGPDNISDKKMPGASGVPGPEKMRSSGRYCANCLPGTNSSRGHDSYT